MGQVRPSDRHQKRQELRRYREVESLREYVLVGTEERSVECCRKDASGHCVLHPFGPGAEVEFENRGFRCSMDAVYEDAGVR